MTDSKKRIPDYLDCGAEFIKRNLKRFIPAFAVYAVFFGLFSYYISGVYNLEALMSLEDSDEALTMAISTLIGTYVGSAALEIAEFIGLVISGMLVYFTYTKLMTGKEPDRKFTVIRGFVYALFSILWNMVAGMVLSVLLTVPLLLFSNLAFFTMSDAGFFGSAVFWAVLIIVFVLAFIVMAVYFYGRISMVAPLMVVKNQNIFKAVKSSWKYTKKRCFRTLVLLASCAILSESAAAVVAAAMSLSFFSYGTATAIASAIINGLAACTGFVQPIIVVFAIVDREKQTGGLDDETDLNSFFAERGV